MTIEQENEIKSTGLLINKGDIKLKELKLQYLGVEKKLSLWTRLRLKMFLGTSELILEQMKINQWGRKTVNSSQNIVVLSSVLFMGWVNKLLIITPLEFLVGFLTKSLQDNHE